MKEEAIVLFWDGFLQVLVALKLFSWLLMNSTAPITWPNSYVDHYKNRFEDDVEG
jgi:hypothetical protein